MFSKSASPWRSPFFLHQRQSRRRSQRIPSTSSTTICTWPSSKGRRSHVKHVMPIPSPSPTEKRSILWDVTPVTTVPTHRYQQPTVALSVTRGRNRHRKTIAPIGFQNTNPLQNKTQTSVGSVTPTECSVSIVMEGVTPFKNGCIVATLNLFIRLKHGPTPAVVMHATPLRIVRNVTQGKGLRYDENNHHHVHDGNNASRLRRECNE